MYFLVYVSSAVEPFTEVELLALLEQSRENNQRLGITGMLVYKDGNFMQALEGEQSVVSELHRRIERDTRHRGMITLLQGDHNERQFPEWSMGFRNLDAPEVRSVPGYSEFLNTPLTAAAFSGQPSRCQKLLLTFKRSM